MDQVESDGSSQVRWTELSRKLHARSQRCNATICKHHCRIWEFAKFSKFDGARRSFRRQHAFLTLCLTNHLFLSFGQMSKEEAFMTCCSARDFLFFAAGAFQQERTRTSGAHPKEPNFPALKNVSEANERSTPPVTTMKHKQTIMGKAESCACFLKVGVAQRFGFKAIFTFLSLHKSKTSPTLSALVARPSETAQRVLTKE
jgi:hypothetical protein